jgi:hypothetical protein
MRAPIKNYDVLKGFIRAFTKMEVFFLANMKREIRFESLGSYAQLMVKYTGYIGHGDHLSVAKRYGLRVSMRYTKEFYVQKLRQLAGRSALSVYSRDRSWVETG